MWWSRAVPYSHAHKLLLINELQRRFDILQEQVQELKLPITLYLGSEIDEDTEMFDFVTKEQCYTLNNSKYILLDFGMRKCEVDDIIYEFIVNGYKPIIAHPERYMYVTGIEKLKRWRKTGALLQMNAGSLFGSAHVKKQAKLMVKHQLVDIIASDAHRNPKSYDNLKDTYKYISKKISASYADIVSRFNPELIRGD